MIKTILVALLGLLMLGACAKHVIEDRGSVPIEAFSGRLLVMATAKRFQVDIDWQGKEDNGSLRLTHASSGRIVDVIWENRSMLWRDNLNHNWQPLTEQALSEMGVILPPWVLAKVFLGDLPNSMKTKDNFTWKGNWFYGGNKLDLKIRWSSDRKRVELVDMKHAKKAVVIIDE